MHFLGKIDISQLSCNSCILLHTTEARKKAKYALIARSYHFVVETSGVFGPEVLILFSDIARRIRAVTKSSQISAALQYGNAATVLGSCH